MRTPMIAGNWKMYKTASEAVFLLQKIEDLIAGVNNVDVVVCPPFTSLRSLQVVIEQDQPRIRLGAQNMHFEEEGAFTGEISPVMLKGVGCAYVILGHSERRHIFGETDETINKKALAALAHDLVPIFCVGETLDERDAGATSDVITHQVVEGLKGVTKAQAPGIIVAYEPVWAIGSGKTATPEMANETILFIRNTIEDLFGVKAKDEIRILYGGSVKAGNINMLMAEPDIDGALVGGASLEPQDFARIVKFTR